MAIIILSFFAVLLSVFGETWDSKAEGFHKLKFLGYATILLATSALFLNLKEINEREDEINELNYSAVVGV